MLDHLTISIIRHRRTYRNFHHQISGLTNAGDSQISINRAMCGLLGAYGSDAGGHRAAAVYTLIETCKMNDVDPQAWLADVLARLPDHPANKVANLLPWNWKVNQKAKAAVAA
jgi:hypothetical protein